MGERFNPPLSAFAPASPPRTAPRKSEPVPPRPPYACLRGLYASAPTLFPWTRQPAMTPTVCPTARPMGLLMATVPSPRTVGGR
jgi:hypothetical protein